MPKTTTKRDPVIGFIERLAGFSSTPAAIACAVLSIVFWSAVGPMFHFSSGWQLTINTVANAGTFLLVFLIQTTHKRARKSLESKLDTLIQRASCEPLTGAEIEKIVNARNEEHGSLRDYLIFLKPRLNKDAQVITEGEQTCLAGS